MLSIPYSCAGRPGERNSGCQLRRDRRVKTNWSALARACLLPLQGPYERLPPQLPAAPRMAGPDDNRHERRNNMPRQRFSLHDRQQQTHQNSQQARQCGRGDPVVARFGPRVSGRRILLTFVFWGSSETHVQYANRHMIAVDNLACRPIQWVFPLFVTNIRSNSANRLLIRGPKSAH